MNEARALSSCRKGPRPTPKPPYVGPEPPRADPSRPGDRFCTPLPNADTAQINDYVHKQAEPAGWGLEGIRSDKGVSVFCFQPIQPL